ncbi:MAG: hypothetical protein R6U63_14605 [Longimicrobiales bacterium]
MRRRRLPTLALALTAVGLNACGGDGPEALQVQRDTIGDTVIVRTLSGSAWQADARLEPEMRIGAFDGEDVYILGDVAGMAVAPDGSIYLYDRQVPALRKYGPDGEFVATFGREGGGPGEYRNSDGGLAVLADGRVLLRDPGNARITVYSPTGETLETWPLRGAHFTSRRFYVDTAGRAYTQIWGRTEDGERYSGLQPFAADGITLDSLLAPTWEYEEAAISLRTEQMAMTNSVPFSPQPHWTFSPHGYFVGGLSSDYAIDLFRPDSTVLRIRRDTEPVPVAAAEKDAVRMSRIRNFQQVAPDWQWNGPSISDTKPFFQDIAAGRDGRIWVRLHQPGYLAEEADPQDPRSVDRWAEPTVWDVFEPDGTYLGQVHASEGFSTHPEPVFGAGHVWAVTTDELDVEYVTRFRIVRGALDEGNATE